MESENPYLSSVQDSSLQPPSQMSATSAPEITNEESRSASTIQSPNEDRNEGEPSTNEAKSGEHEDLPENSEVDTTAPEKDATNAPEKDATKEAPINGISSASENSAELLGSTSGQAVSDAMAETANTKSEVSNSVETEKPEVSDTAAETERPETTKAAETPEFPESSVFPGAISQTKVSGETETEAKPEPESANGDSISQRPEEILEQQAWIKTESSEDAQNTPAVSQNGIALDQVEPASGDADAMEIIKTEPTTAKHPRSESPVSSTKKARTELVVVPHKKPDLVYSPLKTGLVYDVRMRYHAKIFTSYFEYIDPHPEDPRRIYRIYKILAEAGLIQDAALAGSDDIGPLMVKIPVREATASEILEVHTPEHLKFISSTEKMSREQLLDETEKGDSIYVNNDSFLSAKLSCGGSIEACRAVVEGKVKNSLAIVRPPGHHAEPNSPGGFCLFSNVAVAAKNVLRAYPESVRRIVILDWDIHHGNGTQRAFYDDPRVLYISIHRFENGKFYPGTKYGGADKVGDGKGEGFSVNIPWSEAGVGDADYMYAFHKVVIPIMSEFDPDLVIVSAGFDAADGDIIGQCHVTPAGYGQLTHMLKAIARGKLTVILEGGYNLVSISESALGVAKVLVGEPPEATISTQPRADTLETISEVMRIQSKYWECMRPGISSRVFEDSDGNGLNFAEPIRAYQAQELFSKYRFVNLPVLDEKSENSQAYFSTDLPANLEDLVLASDNINECGTVVISVHDSPEVWAYVNPINGSIDCSSSVVLEHPLTRFMEKISEELKTENITDVVGYIDVNIPTSNIDGKDGYNPTIFAQELMLWIWDNYLNYFSALKKVVFIGYGDAYQSIVHLYAKRPSQEVKELVKGTVVFASRSNLKPIVPVMDESMVDWFYQNSVIFASYMNTCWAGSGKGDDDSKRPRRKFGRVLKASMDSAWDITNEKFDEGVDFIVDSIADYSD